MAQDWSPYIKIIRSLAKDSPPLEKLVIIWEEEKEASYKKIKTEQTLKNICFFLLLKQERNLIPFATESCLY